MFFVHVPGYCNNKLCSFVDFTIFSTFFFFFFQKREKKKISQGALIVNEQINLSGPKFP